MPALDQHVCPECGVSAGEQPFCGGCGRNLSQERRLPSRGEWEQEHPDAAAVEKESAQRASRRRWRVLAPVLAVFALVGIVAVVVLLARHDVRTLRVPSGSMEPTIAVGAHVSFEMGQTAPLRVGEVVLVHPPAGAEQEQCGATAAVVTPGGAACSEVGASPSSVLFIKRIVAGPGDTVAIREGRVILNDNAETESYVAPCGGASECNFPTPITIPTGTYFLLGDNRGESDDSRFWGPVPRTWIIGKATHCSFFNVFCSDTYAG